jgi:LysM repeat protein
LVIEKLECLKATGSAHYDYIVLQATDNSISFYESMGFVRVGAITQDEKRIQRHISPNRKNGLAAGDSGESVDDEFDPMTGAHEITSSPTFIHTCKKAESLSNIAKHYNVDPWDIAFLNRFIDPHLSPSTKFKPGTEVQIPDVDKALEEIPAEIVQPQWYIARENDTPRFIAKKFNVNCLELVEANKIRLPELLSNSRLRNKTRIQISDFHIAQQLYQPYAHWTFPDDRFDDGEPGYMMARRLVRQKGIAHKKTPYLQSLAVRESPYQPTTLVIDPSIAVADVPCSLMETRENGPNTSTTKRVPPPNAPKRPLSAFMLYCNQQRPMLKRQNDKIDAVEISRLVSELWRDLPQSKKNRYEQAATQLRKAYLKEKEAYEQGLKEYKADNSNHPYLFTPLEKDSLYNCAFSLFNQVVRLKEGAISEGIEYKYWYV